MGSEEFFTHKRNKFGLHYIYKLKTIYLRTPSNLKHEWKSYFHTTLERKGDANPLVGTQGKT
jgi:hypothetical protein